MSKHRQHVPLWKRPSTVLTATLAASLLVGGAVVVSPHKSVAPLADTSTSVSPTPSGTPEPQDYKATSPVKPVSRPLPRANATQLTEQTLVPIKAPKSNYVESQDAASVAAAQKEYIQTALKYEQSRRNAKRLANESAKKQAEAERLTEEWKAAVKEADRLTAVAEEKRRELGKWAATVYQHGMVTDDSTLMTLLSGPESTEEMIEMQRYLGSVSRSRGNAEALARKAQQEAEDARDLAEKTKKAADDAATQAKNLATQAQEAEKQSAALNTQADQQASELARKINIEEINAGNFSPISASQRVLNTSAVEYWNTYLADLKNAGVVLPSAKELEDPDAYLPEGLAPVLSVDGTSLDGIALHKKSGLTVLPQEVISQVSSALSSVGVAYGTEHTPAQSCEVMVGSLYGNTATDLPTLWTSAQQQTDVLDTMPGDVVYSVDPQSGITQASIYLGAGLVVRASAASGYAEVAKVDSSALGTNRPSVPVTEGDKVTPAPQPQEGAVPWKCGGIEGAGEESSSGWTLPVAAGSYELGVKYGEGSQRWGKNVPSPGIEFLAKQGTPVVAAGNGLATVVKDDPLWGNMVTITHAEGLTSQYSNLSAITVEDGANIAAGTVLGVVGQTGSSANSKQPSVFVQVAFGEIKVDPQVLFFSGSASGSGEIIGKVPTNDGGMVEVNASGHKNGMLPDDVLCSIRVGGHRLRCDAARAYVVLAAAFKAQFGRDLSITDSYRTYQSQVVTKQNKPDLAATPGTSKHGWGLAVDLGGGINTFGSPEYEWMKANAEKYGFWHPHWAEPGGSMPEAWHWEYIATKNHYK